jgi:hypothetical protein
MATMTLAELTAFTLEEVTKKKAGEDAAIKKRQAKEFDANADKLKSQLEPHLPAQIIEECGIQYRTSTSSNAPVMAVICYRSAEINIWKSPTSNWTDWDISCKGITSRKDIANKDLINVLLIDFIDQIDKAVKQHAIRVTVDIEVTAISSDLAIAAAIAAVESNASPDISIEKANAVVKKNNESALGSLFANSLPSEKRIYQEVAPELILLPEGLKQQEPFPIPTL